jgi:hypothetical protein
VKLPTDEEGCRGEEEEEKEEKKACLGFGVISFFGG